MKAVFGIIAVLIYLVAYAPYLFDVALSKVKPQRITWAIWAILTNIVFANQVINGGGWSAYYFGCAALFTSLIFVLSISRGGNKADKADKITLAAALILLMYWLVFHDTRVSTVLVILIDIVITVPTILKAYRSPKTEEYSQWMLAAAGGFLSMLAIAKADFVLYLYPLYIIVINGLIVWAKYYAEHEKPKLENT